MSTRATLLLLALAVALGVYVWRVELVGKQQKQEAEQAAKKLLRIERDAITALELPLEDGGIARIVRDAADGHRWRLESPLAFAADDSAVSSALSALVELQSEATFPKPPDPEPFGLGTSRQAVRVWTGEADPQILWLGGSAPVGASRYVALESDPEHVYTTSEGRIHSLKPRLVSLRDKRITTAQIDDVTGYGLREKGALVVSAKREAPPPEVEKAEGEKKEAGVTAPPRAAGPWRLLEPLAEEADGERIRRAIESLVFARASDFVDQPKADKEYGLDKPELEVLLERSGASEKLEIGHANSKAWVRVNGGAPVFELPERLLTDLPRKLFDYRFKQVLRLDEQKVHRLEVGFPRDGTEYAFVEEGQKWRSEKPDVEVESLEIEDLLYGIRDLQATAAVEESAALSSLGLEPALVRIVAKAADGAELGWVELGEPDAGAGIPVRASTGERIWRVANDLARDVPLGDEAFRNHFVKKPPAPPSEPEKKPEESPAGPTEEEE